MRCDELRATVGGLGLLDAEAEEHLLDCEACFTWLERRDPLAEALRAARPPEVQPSPELAGEVVRAWRTTALLPAPGRAILAASAAAFMGVVGALSVMAVMAVLGTRLGQITGLVGKGLGSFLAPVSALGGFASGQLRDHPVWVLGLAAVATLAAWAWTRIDTGISATMRGSA